MNELATIWQDIVNWLDGLFRGGSSAASAPAGSTSSVPSNVILRATPNGGSYGTGTAHAGATLRHPNAGYSTGVASNPSYSGGGGAAQVALGSSSYSQNDQAIAAALVAAEGGKDGQSGASLTDAQAVGLLTSQGFTPSQIANSGALGAPSSDLALVGQSLPTGASVNPLPTSAYVGSSDVVQGPTGELYVAHTANGIVSIPVTNKTDIAALNRQYGVGNQ